MTDQELFSVVGILPEKTPAALPKRRRKLPLVPLAVLAVIVLGCLCAPLLTGRDPAYMDLATVIAVVYGAVSGMAAPWLDTAMMRLTELLGSVPSLLLVLFLQAILGTANVLSLSLVIGVTGWCAMAKVVRTEVRQLRHSGYVIACRCMGGSFHRVLWRHLAPNFVSSILFMVVMSVSTAIAAESTLSFLGMGLPLDIISWGSMLTLSQQALNRGAWWIIVIPGAFLVAVLVCVTAIGGWLRRAFDRRQSNL